MSLGTDQFHGERGQSHIFFRRESTDCHCSHHFAVLPDWKATTPADVFIVAVIGNVMALLWMFHLVADIFCWLALAGGSPGFIHGDPDGRDRGAIHAHEVNEVAMRIGYRDRSRLL